jgi:murein L,D-transpeptidase YafK
MATWRSTTERYTTARSSVTRSPAAARLRRVAGALLVAGVLAGCQADELGYGPKAQRPISADVKRKMGELDMKSTSPIMIRIFKEENQLEVWKQKRNGRYAMLDSFEICKWSGKLGPKFKEGDRQAPEGFYEITPGLMNPNSSYHLAFNLGYPNKYDRSHGRTGSHLMVHGACSSRGCYAMTDAQVQDIYALARDSFKGGQRSFQVQAFPFKMTPENMARHRGNDHMDFWRMLKRGYDHFEVTQVPPKISVCEKKYVFDATTLVEGVPFKASAKCPDYEVPSRLEQLVAKKQRKDDEKFQQIVARADAREERKKRWEEKQTQIAEALGGGNADTETAEATEASAGTETASTEAGTPEQKQSGQVFALQAKPKESRTAGFFKRWVPFGNKAEDNESTVGPIDTTIVPAAKP